MDGLMGTYMKNENNISFGIVYSISFSCKILWLHLSPTYHNPKVIARFYLEAVEEIAGMYNKDYDTNRIWMHTCRYSTVSKI